MKFDKQKSREDLELGNKPTYDYLEATGRIMTVHMPAALDRIEELEAALIDQTAMIIFHDQMMPFCSMRDWNDLSDEDREIMVGGMMWPLKGKTYWKARAREQLQAEGKL